MTAPNILVVQNDPVTSRVLEYTLGQEGFSVVQTGDAASALAAASVKPVDLVLQDLVLPDSDGIDLARQLRNLHRGADLPIVALTGSLHRHDAARVLRAGFNDILIKPVRRTCLVHLVRTYVSGSSIPRRAADESRHVLIVDDDLVQLKLMLLHLSVRGFRVTTARDGIDAMEVARLAKPDAILSDVFMPRADGFTLCRKIRADERLSSTPVVLMSSQCFAQGDQELASEVGADALLSRAANIGVVVDCLVGALNRARPSGAHAPVA